MIKLSDLMRAGLTHHAPTMGAPMKWLAGGHAVHMLGYGALQNSMQN